MKKIKLLLLLVMTIVTQGVWGQEGPELTTGVIGITCPSHENYFGDDEIIQSSANYSALYHYVPSRSGTLLIKDIASEPTTAVVTIFNSDRSFVAWAYGSYFAYNVEVDHDYYIGFAPMYSDESLDNEQFYINLYCTDNCYNITSFERQEPTCTAKGMKAYIRCEDCGGLWDEYGSKIDPISLILPYGPHKFHAGECENCDYVAQTITLTKNGNDYTFDGNVNYDLKSSVGENSGVSIFHVHTPAHGIVNVSAHVARNEGRFDAYPPYLYFYQEGHNENQGYSTNLGYSPALMCEDNLIANADYYLVVKNAEATNASLEITLHPHETTCIQERVNPTCTTGGVKALYSCSTCSYYFTDEGDVLYNTDAQYRTLPALGHNLNENGVCSRCGIDIHITEGTHEIIIPACQSTGNNIEDYSYLSYFVAPRSGSLNIGLDGNYSRRKTIAVFKKGSNEEWQLLESRYNGYTYSLNYNANEGEEFIIGIRPYLNLSEIQNVSLKVKVLCTEHKWEYFEYKEPTCYESGHGAYRHCTICDTDYEYNVDVEIVPSFYDRSDHKFVNGVCQDCHYEVPTIELVKNEETGLYEYTNDSFKFDLKSSRWGDACSIFRVFVPEHGEINIKAYADFDDEWSPFAIEQDRYFEYSKGSSEKSKAAPIKNSESIQECIPGGCYMYVLVRNNEAVESRLEVSLAPHEVQCVQQHVDASCEDGMKAVYHCLSGCNDGYYYFTEDGIIGPDDSDVIIPGIGHQEDEDGVCTVCGHKVRLTNGENQVQFTSGEDVVTAFKYVASETNCLNVAVESNASINDYEIMLWSEWKPSYDDEKPLSAPRKVSGTKEVAPLMTKNVVAGQEYAIVLYTSAENDEDATITLSFTDIVYPELTEGSNTINVSSNDVNLNDYTYDKPETYELYKYVAKTTGTLYISSTQNAGIMTTVFDEGFNAIWGGDPYYDSYSVEVEGNNTYYIGVRTYNGYEYYNYTIDLEIEGLPEFEGTLELAKVDDDKNVTEYDFETAFDNFFKGNLPELNSPNLIINDGVTYMRKATTSKWGTVVLPYELQSNDKVAYYELTGANISQGELQFTKVDKVAPNTPTVYRIISGNQYDASVEGPVTIKIPKYLGDFNLYTCYYLGNEDEEWYLDGWYYEATIDTQHDEYFIDGEGVPGDPGIMYISGDKFWHAEGSVKVKPYRAVFEIYGVDWNTTSNQVKAMNITFVDENGEETKIQSIMDENGEQVDISGIYDINGRKINQMQKGVNIIRTADGKTRKVINNK